MSTVLIVDDSRMIRKFVSNCVTSIGGKVVGQACDGEEGLESFRTLNPDVVLLDITMPNKDGRDCLREILQINPRATVVMLSGLNSEEVIKDCLKIGAKAYLDKTTLSEQSLLETELKRFIKTQAA